jgi:hypothetical protein
MLLSSSSDAKASWRIRDAHSREMKGLRERQWKWVCEHWTSMGAPPHATWFNQYRAYIISTMGVRTHFAAIDCDTHAFHCWLPYEAARHHHTWRTNKSRYDGVDVSLKKYEATALRWVGRHRDRYVLPNPPSVPLSSPSSLPPDHTTLPPPPLPPPLPSPIAHATYLLPNVRSQMPHAPYVYSASRIHQQNAIGRRYRDVVQYLGIREKIDQIVWMAAAGTAFCVHAVHVYGLNFKSAQEAAEQTHRDTICATHSRSHFPINLTLSPSLPSLPPLPLVSSLPSSSPTSLTRPRTTNVEPNPAHVTERDCHFADHVTLAVTQKETTKDDVATSVSTEKRVDARHVTTACVARPASLGGTNNDYNEHKIRVSLGVSDAEQQSESGGGRAKMERSRGYGQHVKVKEQTAVATAAAFVDVQKSGRHPELVALDRHLEGKSRESSHFARKTRQTVLERRDCRRQVDMTAQWGADSARWPLSRNLCSRRVTAVYLQELYEESRISFHSYGIISDDTTVSDMVVVEHRGDDLRAEYTVDSLYVSLDNMSLHCAPIGFYFCFS